MEEIHRKGESRVYMLLQCLRVRACMRFHTRKNYGLGWTIGGLFLLPCELSACMCSCAGRRGEMGGGLSGLQHEEHFKLKRLRSEYCSGRSVVMFFRVLDRKIRKMGYL